MSTKHWVTVYRGFDPLTLDLIEAALRAENLAPRRIGKANPALLGVGAAAVEQLIEVRREHEPSAQALIAAAQRRLASVQSLADLEAQALRATTPQCERMTAEADQPRGWRLEVLALLVAAGLLILLVLR